MVQNRAFKSIGQWPSPTATSISLEGFNKITIPNFTCRSCQQEFPLDRSYFHFIRDQETKQYRPIKTCKICQRRTRRSSIQQRSGRMLYDAKKRSIKKNIPFNLTREWIQQKLVFGRCELSALPFEYGAKKGRLSPFTPSIDRIVPALGYTQQNCRVICYCLNNLFGTWGEASSLEIIIAYLKNRGIYFE